MILGNVFQQLYSLVDSVVVGKFIGVNALAGVGATNSLTFLILGSAEGLTGAFSVMAGQTFGARQYPSMRSYIANSFYIMLGISVVFTPVTMLLTRPVLSAMQTPSEIIDYSTTYLMIMFAGILPILLYNVTASILQALGDSKTPLISLIIASVLNIGLDLLLVAVLDWGVAGAALATVLSQLVSGVLCFIYMFRKFDVLKYEKGEKKADLSKIRKLLSMGIPMALQFSITALGSLVIQIAVNSLGASAVAAVTAGGKVTSIFEGAFTMVGLSMINYTAQNCGARKLHRVRQGVRAGLAMGLMFCAFSIAIILLFGNALALLFLGRSETAILDMTREYEIINCLFYPALLYLYLTRNSSTGMGYTMSTLFSGAAELAGRVVAAVILTRQFGFTGACFANPCAWTAADIALTFVYIHSLKRKEREFAQEAQASTVSAGEASS